MENSNTDRLHTQLMIVGAGMAGMSAALFAADAGIDTVQAGLTSEIIYASGFIDLLAVHPLVPGKLWDNPWQGVAQLQKDDPQHPYAKLAPSQIRQAIQRLTQFLGDMGLPYAGHDERNARLLTTVGTIKRTYRAPHNMWAGAAALHQTAPCLIVDIEGLRGFSGRQIVQTLHAKWPELRAATIRLPFTGRQGPNYPELLARSLELPEARQQLADMLLPHIGDARYIGLPAVLGVHHTVEAIQELKQLLAVEIFEIPTMPPAVTGLRIKEIFDTHLPKRGVQTFYHHKVLSVQPSPNGQFILEIGQTDAKATVVAEHLLLATGRFLGKGLVAERDGIHEPLLDLPVAQPPHRSQWHRASFLAAEGHAINRAGLEVDDCFRPQKIGGGPVYPNLYAAGSILAHQDWIRSKSGTGIAAATAYAAVAAIARQVTPSEAD
jgi:glycerol-3-phosphate dehydrogenase subunit B